MRKYGKSKTTRIMMATVPHITSGSGLRKFQADGFLFDRVHVCHRLFLRIVSHFCVLFLTWHRYEHWTLCQHSLPKVILHWSLDPWNFWTVHTAVWPGAFFVAYPNHVIRLRECLASHTRSFVCLHFIDVGTSGSTVFWGKSVLIWGVCHWCASSYLVTYYVCCKGLLDWICCM
jgi:hypothetical protein